MEQYLDEYKVKAILEKHLNKAVDEIYNANVVHSTSSCITQPERMAEAAFQVFAISHDVIPTAEAEGLVIVAE